MKKVLCLILSVLLVVLSFPVSALAGEDDNKFSVSYVTYWYGDEKVTSVKADGEDVESGDTKEFVTGSQIAFTLVRPESWKEDETPVVEIEVYDGDEDTPNTVWRSDYEEGNVIEINDDEFTFTPTSDAYFDVFVYWNEFEAFDGGEGNFCIEIGKSDNGTIEFSEAYVDFVTDGWRTKYAFPVGTDVTVKAIPNAGYEVKSIGDYCKNPVEEWEKPFSDITFNSADNSYEYTISGATERREYYAYAEFELSSEGVYQVQYEQRFDKETGEPNQCVKIGGKILDDGSINQFEKSVPIEFTLYRSYGTAEKPVVEIEVLDGDEDNPNTIWRSDFKSRDPHKISISGNKFSFTPATDTSFIVRVYWNEYDGFYCGEGKYCIIIDEVENGKIELSETTDNYITNGWSTKYAFPVETDVTVKVIPDAGYDVEYISTSTGWYGKDILEDDGFEKPLSKLYNSKTKNYEYTISEALEKENYFVNAYCGMSEEGAYQVFYNGYYDAYDNLLCYVKAGGKILKNEDVSSFKKNEPITFTIVPPDNEDLKVAVKIKDNEGNVWRSDYAAGDPDKIDISGNKFTFTPKSDNSFTVYVYWNEYEAFDCGKGNYYIEYFSQGKIEFSKEPLKSVTDGVWQTKCAFPVDEDLTVYIIPDENYELYSVSFNGEDVYCIDPSEEWGEKPLSKLTYNSGKGGYEYTIEANTVPQGEQYYIETEYKMASEHAYQIEYDEQYDEDWETPVAYVKVGNNIVERYSACSFVTNNELEFTMVPPENRSTDTPIVEIEVYDGDEDTPNTILRSDFGAGDEHKIDIVGNKFSFTPKTDKSFVVRVWWSDFDAFDCGEGNYYIYTIGDENGSFKFSKTPVKTMVHGNEAKYAFSIDDDVKVIFVPDNGYELSTAVIDWLTYDNDPETEGYNLSKLYNAQNQRYEFNILSNDRWEGEKYYIEARYEKEKVKPAKRKNSSVVTIGKKAADLREENPDTGAFVG